MEENIKSPQVAATTSEEKKVNQFIYFYKENGENHLVVVSEGNDIKSVFNMKKHIQNDFPKSKNNLYVLIHGVEFKL